MRPYVSTALFSQRKCRVPLSLDLGVAAVENKHVLADTQMEFQRKYHL